MKDLEQMGLEIAYIVPMSAVLGFMHELGIIWPIIYRIVPY